MVITCPKQGMVTSRETLTQTESMAWRLFCLVQVQRCNNWVLDTSSITSLNENSLKSCRSRECAFCLLFWSWNGGCCPTQGRIFRVFFPKQGQDFKPSAAPLCPNMGQIPLPPAVNRINNIPFWLVHFVFPIQITWWHSGDLILCLVY